MYLEHSRRVLPASDRVNFSKTQVSPFLSVLFSERRLTSILEATDSDSLH